MKWKNVVLVSDIDGTLLKTGNPPHSKSINAIREFVLGGGKMALSTGRAVAAIKRVVDLLPINLPCIVCGGSMIYDFHLDCVVWSKAMDPIIWGVLDWVLEKNKGVSITVYTETTIQTIRSNHTLLESGVYEDRMAPIVKREKLSEPLVKVLFTCDNTEVLKELGNHPVIKRFFEYKAASRHFYEMTAKGVNKGKALEILCSLYDIKVQKVFVAGDGETDAMMKTYATRFYVPETAPKSVRKKADIIFPSPEFGGISEIFNSFE